MKPSFPLRATSAIDLTRAFVYAALVEGPTVLDRVKVRAEGRRGGQRASGRLPTSADWQRDLHGLIDVTWPCSLCSEFMTSVWPAIQSRAGRPPAGRDAHDGDAELAHAAWSVTRHAAPRAVVETGVGRGFTSAAVLYALKVNASGHLYSIDLPPLAKGWREQSAIAVDTSLKDRWTYVRGTSRRRLPPLVARLRQFDVFVHDSLHTARTMTFEFESAWEPLRPGGILISDDIDDNPAFESFVRDHGGLRTVIGQELSKAGSRFGVLRKPHISD